MRVLVLGDHGTGKSSLICSLVSQHFSEDGSGCPAVYNDVVIPAGELFDSTCNVTIADSSPSMSVDALADLVLSADSILLVHDTGMPTTLQSCMDYWLPFIQVLNVPAALCSPRL